MLKKRLKVLPALLVLFVLLFQSTVLASEYPEMAIEVDGHSMVINSDYPSEDIPEGYYETQMQYQGVDFYGGMDQATSTIQLFFLRCEDDPSLSGFYQLTAEGTFVKYKTPLTVDGRTFAPTEPDQDSIPEGYVQTETVVGNDMLTAWQINGASGDSMSMFLIYGTLNGGENGWYSYDQRDGTIQRYMGEVAQKTISDQADKITNLESQLKDLNTKYNHRVGRTKNLFILSLVLSVLFFFLMLNAILKRKHERMDLEDRIIDLKRHRGEETQNFTKREARRNKKLDEEAAARADKIEDDIAYEAEKREQRRQNRQRRYAEEQKSWIEQRAEDQSAPSSSARGRKNSAKSGGRKSDSAPARRNTQPRDDRYTHDAALEELEKNLESGAIPQASGEKVKTKVMHDYHEAAGDFAFVDLDDDDEPVGGALDDSDLLKAQLEGSLEEALKGADIAANSEKKPVKGLTEDMAAAMRLDESDDFDMNIIDLD